MSDSDFNQVAQEFCDNVVNEIGEEEFAFLQQQTYVFRILVSMYYTESTDIDVLTNHIADSFNGLIPYEQVKYIVRDFVPHMLNDTGFFVDGVLTDDAIMIAQQHNKMLQLGYEEPITKLNKTLH
jgi:hypothetical protein